MADLDEILRTNPRAAQGIDEIRDVLAKIQKLRNAGIIAKPDLTNPHGNSKSLSDLKTNRRSTFKKNLYA